MHEKVFDTSISSPQQTASDLAITGAENATALVNAGGNASIDQSRSYIINYYYRDALRASVIEATATVTADLPCPYRGLFHFGPDDADIFFGRAVFVAELIQAVQSRSFVPVLGASGSGKSSVVLAGLVPALRQKGQWKFTHFCPGEDPFHALALALIPLYTTGLDETDRIVQTRKLATYLRAKEILLTDVIAQIQHNYPGDRILLIADQFEELYTLCREESVRHQFLDCLLASLSVPSFQMESPLVLVATMRADFLGHALAYRPFADILQNADIKLGAMNQRELWDVIEQPAAKRGVRFEAGLVDRILQDVAAEPGNLPLLEFALTELWKRRTGLELTHAAYTAIEGVQGALARHADASYHQLNQGEQVLVRQLMMELVQLGDAQEITRRRVGWEQLRSELRTIAPSPEQLEQVIDKLAGQRLIVTDEQTVEVAHEALLTGWPFLKQLIEENREAIRLHHQLENDCQEWQKKGRSQDYLLSPGRLAVFEEWSKHNPAKLPDLEAEYLKQSREKYDLEAQQQLYQERQLRAAAEAREQAQRRGKRLAIALSIVTIFSTCGIMLGVMKWKESDWDQIRSQTNVARTNFAVNPDALDALLEAVKAGKQLQQSFWFRHDRELQAEMMEVLVQTSNWVKEYNRLEGHKNFVWAVSFSPNGQTLATGGWDNTLRLWNAAGTEQHVLRDHTGPVTGVAFSRDGKFLATCSQDGTIKIRDASNGVVLKPLAGRKDKLWRVRFSPDGKTVAAVSEQGYITLWNWQTNEPPKVWQGHRQTAYDVDFNTDGRTIATAGEDGLIKLWTRQGQPQGQPLAGHRQAVTTVRFSPTGNMLASGSKDNTVVLWNWQKRIKQKTLQGHKRPLTDVQFSPDGQRLAAGGEDAIVFLWNRTGNLLTTLNRHQEQVTSLSFSPDGQHLASASADGTVKLWQIQPHMHVLNGYSGAVSVVSMKQPDGQLFATDNGNNAVKIWRSNGTLQAEWQEPDSVYGIDFSPTKNMLAVTNGLQINLRNLQGKRIGKPIAQQDGLVLGVSFSPDGQILATAAADRSAKLWTLAGQLRAELKEHRAAVHSVRFSPDGQTIATASWDGTVKLWDVQGRLKRSLQASDSQVYRVAFSPDSQTIAAVGNSLVVKLWQVDGTPLPPLEGHTKAVMDVSFSPNGQWIATGSNDGTIKLWSRDSRLLLTLLRQAQPINALSFTPDQQWLVAGSGNQAVLLIDAKNLTLDGLMQRGCHHLQHYKPAAPFCQN